MKIAKIIVYILSQLLRAWVTAFAGIAVYVPLSALAFAERGYKAIGGEIIPVILVVATVWVGFDYCAQLWYRSIIEVTRDDD